MKLTLDWQKKALILFAAAVLIFSVILTVFAIREAERDKLAKLLEIDQEQEQIAEAIDEQVLSRLRNTEERILELFAQNYDPVDKEQLKEGAEKLKVDDELVDQVFYIDRNGHINFPLFKPLFTLNDIPEPPRSSSLEIENSRLFVSAEKAEYQDKNYSLAINKYRQLMRSTPHNASRALLLNRLARCYVAIGGVERAIQTYRSIINDFNEIISPEGIPYALIALHQLGVLYAGTNDNPAHVSASLDLYAALLEPKWQLSRTQFNFYLRKATSSLNAINAQGNASALEREISERWTELEHIEKEKSAKMDGIEMITNRIRPVFAARESEAINSPSTFFHFADRSADSSLLISYAFPDNQSVFGFTLNIPLLEKVVLPSILNTDELGEEFHVQIANFENNQIIAGEKSWEDDSRFQHSFTQGFSENFPPWEIKIYQAVPNQAEQQFRLRRNIYVLSVLVVITAILLGGILAIRSTGKELRLAKLKSEFVSTVSHEFRTPLTSIRYLADLLQRGRVKDENKKQQYYESITHESERLSRLIENILDFSKIEAGMKEYEFVETDVSAICSDVASRFQEQVAPLEFTIESDIAPELPKISADKEALSRAIFNVLDNAAKYSGSSRTIIFQVWNDPQKVFLKVVDQGIGIKNEDQEMVFQKFFRSGEIQDSSIKGSGIGLTLVSHIVMAHNGEVNLKSELGEGTEVTIRLPISNKQE